MTEKIPSIRFNVCVRPLPSWLDWSRLLGPGAWVPLELEQGVVEARAELDRDAAADLAARLRGVGIGGAPLAVEISPALNRKELRKALTEEARRYRKGSVGFSKRSARLDDEGKMSLTPELLALDLGKRACRKRVIDACAGVGGNAIGFARAGCEVVAIEINASRLAMARHNAALYGVVDRIEFIVGDARRLLPELDADLLFIDPPWGGRYSKDRVVLEDLQPCAELLECGKHLSERWIKVPPSFDPATLPNAEVEAFFGVASGDERRVKFLLLRSKSDL